MGEKEREGMLVDDDKKNIEPVPYFIHEGVVTRMAECNKKLLIALIVAVVAILLNNVVWLIYEGTVHSDDRGSVVYEQEADT